ncbi:hypothetical protein VitviT2T_000298 [Vitis vinifera]|uniref:Cotton fiber protein n=2 Tax=Vitis vinifera TaxID=29760 RepID=A0ABY9BC67_VITVI|nr:uncharacterized protein LOC100266460 [Vitis vinifera]WJZ80370.1 hypothetical protein VitviT2T_000298 [Vitis vinifera]|eukprot:XP_003631219.1 PREDICTED: uncharacterized protein LOC100266460 [Vitis vinifera]
MPKKRSPIFQKVSNLLRISIFVGKMGKPISSNLIVFLRKSRKPKDFKLLKHYNYGNTEEYQFSPSSTPLFQYRGKTLKNGGARDMCSMFFLCRCLGSFRADPGDGDYALEALPAVEDANAGESWGPLDWGDEEDSVDQRAERFIERFYEEMRMQRQDSALQITAQ